jgi:hypothetical protein
MLPNPDSQPEPLNEAIDDALEGSLRAEQWQELAAALRNRRERVLRDLELADDLDEKEELEEQLKNLDDQIQVLTEEASITAFVENTVKFSYEVRRHSDG